MNSTSTKLSTKEQQKIQEIQEKQEKQEKYLKKQIDLLQQELLCFQTKEKEYTIQNEYLKKQFDDFQFEFQQKQTIWQEETFFLRKQKQEVEKNIQLLQTLLESSKNEHNHTINQMNTKNQSIEEQNLFLQQELTRIKKELIDTYRKLDQQQQQQAVFTCGTGNTTTNTTNFGVHVDLKRENYQLKAQIEEMKALQKKYLTTAKKQTMKFPAI
jgi:chromosome segregation ATPase